MTNEELIEALLDIVDAERSDRVENSEKLVVLGYAERRTKGFWPTNAGWNFLGQRGRAFDLRGN